MTLTHDGLKALGVKVSLAAALSLILFAFAVPIRGQATPSQQPVFRTSSDLVSVDVSVESGGSRVPGLMASDFTVIDNGVRQKVESIDTESLPVDVTLVADVSAGTAGAGSNAVTSEGTLVQLNKDLALMQSILRPNDRLRLLTSDSLVHQLVPMGPATSAAQLATLDTLGQSSTYDSLISAMLRGNDPNRRHLIVAWTKATDTMSIATADDVRTVARQADAVLHIVQRDVLVYRTTAPIIGTFESKTSRLPTAADYAADAEPPSPSAPTVLPPTQANEQASRGPSDKNIVGDQMIQHAWKPHRYNDLGLLSDVAELTGGTLYGLGVFSDKDPAETFRQIFDSFRHGYVLRYAPTGVKREGWHDITIAVPKLPNASIRARHGYAIEAAAPATRAAQPAIARAAATASPASIASLASLTADTPDGQIQNRIRQVPDLRAFIREFRSVDSLWPGTPRLEAAFALRLGSAGLLSADAGARDEGARLLDRERGFVRSPFDLPASFGLAANRFECAWHELAIAAFEGALQPGPARSMLPDMLDRCPDSARLYLARAVLDDQIWSTSAGRTAVVTSGRVEVSGAEILTRYDDATRYPAVAAEARVRAAWLAYRMKELTKAETLLASAPVPGTDPIVVYFHHVVRAQTLRRLDRTTDAIAAYRAALQIFPGAQSARVGLMTLLLSTGDRAGSERLAEAIETAPASEIDPWWVYWLGDYRSFSARLDDLRAMQ